MIYFDKNDPRYEVEANLIREAINNTLDTLFDREKRVLILRMYEGKTLQESGNEFNITRERVRQVEAKALRKLRHPKRADPLFCVLMGWSKYELEEYKKALDKEEKRKERIEEAKRAKQREKQRLIYQKRREKVLEEARARRIEEDKIINKKREWAEYPPDILTLEYANDGRPYIGVPEWCWFNPPREVYDRWLEHLLDKAERVSRENNL